MKETESSEQQAPENESNTTFWPHQSVMLNECLEALQPDAGGAYLDATLGMGGHTEGILELSSPDGRVWGMDQDPFALKTAQERLTRYRDRFVPVASNFSHAASYFGKGQLDGILLDLGVSSPQLDRADRGFSFMKDGPLDMRMNPEDTLTAESIVNEAPERDLASIFHHLGEERHARFYARRIVARRKTQPFVSTLDLAEFIQSIRPGKPEKIHAATRVFQALRMRVNGELESLRNGLIGMGNCLKTGGRLVVLTFHSLEAKVVKRFGDLFGPAIHGRSGPMKHGESSERERLRCRSSDVWLDPGEEWPAFEMRWIQRKGLKAGEAETSANPRSRSAQLRILERVK